MEGSVQLWGMPVARPELITTGSFVDFAVGTSHQCYVTASGEAWCWGENNVGQLGNGTSPLTEANPVRVSGPADIVAIAATTSRSGGTHPGTCAVHMDGGVSCWGSNRLGLHGTGTYDSMAHPLPQRVPGVSGAVDVVVGYQHACARRADGTVTCWGYNAQGQVGSGAISDLRPAADVAGITTAIQIYAGAIRTCALLADRTLSCWGDNGGGGLGDGTTTTRGTPLVVPGLSSVVNASVGLSHTCAVRTDGTLLCWGGNGIYQLGTGTTTDELWATTGPPLTGVVEVAAAAYHTCARLSDGTVRCWGDNSYWQIGDGTSVRRATPTSPAF